MNQQVKPVNSLKLSTCLLVYFCLTGMCLVLHDRMVDTPAYEARVSLHKDFMTNKAPAPIQYRVMVYYGAEGLQHIGVPFKTSYLLIRGIATFAAAVLFHVFLSTYFSLEISFLGTILLLATFPFTYINYFMQEMDPINLAFFIGSCIVIRSRRDLCLPPLLAVAMTNRETPVLLPLIWLFYRWDELNLKELILKFAFFNVITIGIYLGLRLYFGTHPSYSEQLLFLFNLRDWRTYVYSILIIGPYILPSIRSWPDMPKFLRRAILFVPFFVLFHVVFTILQETRLLLPVLPIMIAGAFAAWFGISGSNAAFQKEEQKRTPSGWMSYSKTLYIVFFLAFAACMALFYKLYERTYLESMRSNTIISESTKLGIEKYNHGEFQDAIAQWAIALRYDTDNFELHYNIALCAIENLHDPLLAKIHINACRRIKPSDSRIEILSRQLQQLTHASTQ